MAALETGRSGHGRRLAGLILLTAVALGLRLIAANSGLWIDEIFSLVDSYRLPLTEIVSRYPGDTHHPFYAVLAHLSLAGFGESAWAIRLPAILAGAVSVPLLYRLGTEVTSRREAAYAAVLLAVSYHHVWFSQNARGYALLAAAAIAGCWLLLRWQATGRARFAAGFAVVTALGAYTHLTMVFIAMGQAIAMGVHLAGRSGAADRRRLTWGTALAFLGAAAGTVLLYAPAMGQVLEHYLHRPSQLVGVSTPGWALREGLRVLAAGIGAGRPALGAAVVIVGGAVFLAGLASYARTNRSATALFLLPGAAVVAGAIVARGTMYPRFFFALAGFGVLIAVRGIVVSAGWLAARLGAGATGGARLATAAVALLVILSLVSLVPNYRYPKQDFLGAVAHIESHRAPGDTAAVVGVTDFAIRRYLGRDWALLTDDASLAALRQREAVWIAWAFPRYLAVSAPGILATLDRECTQPAVFRGTVGGGDVHVCRLEPTP